MLCCRQHPQPPSLASVDLENTVQCKFKFNPQTHLCFSDIAVDNALPHVPSPSNWNTQRETNSGKEWNYSYGKNKWRSLPSHSIAIILNSLWQCSWSFLSVEQPHTTIKVKIKDHVRHALLAANVPPHFYTGHSFHIRAATTAASAGIEDSTIQDIGKAQPTSSTSGGIPLIWHICPPPWHSALFKCHQHLYCMYQLLLCYTYTYQCTVELRFIACLGASGYKE